MFLRSILLGAAVAVLFAAPASADLFLNPLQPCYVVAQKDQRELVYIDATGFTKLGQVDIVVDDTDLTTADVLYDGSVHGSFPAPLLDGDQRDFSVRLTERGNAANTITTVSKVTKFSVTQTPKSARTDDRVRFRGRGFMAGTYVWAHYVFNGRSRKTVQVAYPEGPCGTFDQRRLQFPFKKRPAFGSWTIQFDQLPTYDPMATTKVLLTIKVKPAPKRPRGR
jgi:hypothetical protein